MTTIDDRVQAGTAWLDENRPGWVERINLETLDPGDCVACILGQLDGDYCATLASTFGGRIADPVRLGFAIDEWAAPAAGEAFAALSVAWRRCIVARRAERVAVSA